MKKIGNISFRKSRIGSWSGLTFFSLLVFFGALTPTQAQVDVSANVDRNQVSVGDSFTLKVSITSESGAPSQPSLPVIDNVQLLHSWTSNQSRTSFSSQGQGGLFKTVRIRIHSFQYTVLQQKNITIDPIEVKVDDKTYSTEPIEIQVLAPGLAQQQNSQGTRPQQPQQQPQGFPKDPIEELEDRFNDMLRRQFGGVPGADSFMTEPRNSKEAFFILAEVDKTQAFKGEQITASWYLYTRGRVQDIDTLKYPTLKGFWKEDIQISTHLNFEQDVINGIPYNRALLASYALFPIEEGKQLVDPYKAKATIVSGFGFGRSYPGTKASDQIPILIKPLPEEGRPMDFTGAVGEFQFTVEPPHGTIVTHQPFELKVRFEGRGNAKLIELPQLPLGDNLEVYDIKNESKFFKNGQSFKEFEVLLIPREPGPLVIEPLKTSFFDPRQEKYISLQSDPIQLNVLPGAKQQSIGEERLKSDLKKKVLPDLVTEWDPNLKAGKSNFFIWPLLFALAFLVLVAKSVRDSGLLNKNPSLDDMINLRFGKIDVLQSKGLTRKVGIEATNTVYLVLGQLSGEGGASEELDKLLAKTPPSVRREIEAPLSKLVDYFGVLGFGPANYVKDFKDKKGLKQKVAELRKLLVKACQLSKGKLDKDEA